MIVSSWRRVQQRLLAVRYIDRPPSSLPPSPRCSLLSSVVVSVLCSAGCRSLLTRLSALQAACDRFDVEAVRLVYERLATQHGPQLHAVLWDDAAASAQQMEQRIRAVELQHKQALNHAVPHCVHRLSSATTTSARLLLFHSPLPLHALTDCQ